jgi:hypothetical protein
MVLISLLIIGIFTSEDTFTAVYVGSGVFPNEALSVFSLIKFVDDEFPGAS